jgi:glutamine synthetase
LRDAVDAAEADGFVRGVLGDGCYDILIEQARREITFVEHQVTDVERDRYLGNL